MPNQNRSIARPANTTLLVVLIVVGVLYFARSVLIPVALAVLLTFLLAPLAVRLRRKSLGRIPSALAVVALLFLVLAVLGTFLTSQLTELTRRLPGYQTNVHQKIEAIRASSSGILGRFNRVIGNFTADLSPRVSNTDTGASNEEKPVPVEVRKPALSPFQILQKILGSALSILGTAAIAVVFLIFILIEREALRDRLIRLGGARRVNITTTMLDDAARRVSRYLVAQLIINATYGLLAGVVVLCLGVPNPFLWGIVAMLLRYIPYLGIWIAAALPALVAFAVEPGWIKVPLIFGIYFGIDLVMYNFVEPVLYGSSTGLSPLAVLVAAVFWTWLWGGVGLLLATPLTVCVVVLGRHVPQLWFLRILLSDEPVLTPATRLYQRMLAMDLDEATEVAEDFLKRTSLEELFDRVLAPALSLAEQDRHQGRLDEEKQRFLFQNIRILIEDMSERAGELINGSRESPSPPPPSESGPASVLCVPARDEADEVAGLMLIRLLGQRGVRASTLPGGALAGESIAAATQQSPAVVCLLGIPPSGYAHARYLSRRLRIACPDLKLVGAILTETDIDSVKRREPPLAVDEVASSLREAVAALVTLTSLRIAPKPEPTMISS